MNTLNPSSAAKLLGPGDCALCLFTDGAHLELNPDGTGASGWWAISPDHEFNRVIIYKSLENSEGGEIHLARKLSVEGPRTGDDEKDRYLVRFTETIRLGLTDEPWKKFASTGQNPVRYLRHAERV